MEQPRPISPPPNFPVTWERPEDERMFWTQDRMHWPDPVPVIIFDVMIEEGLNAAAADYSAPIRFTARRINCYQYSAFHPPMVPPEELHAMGERAQQKVGETIGRLGERWEGEWLPEIKQNVDWWDAFDLPGASLPALLAHLDETFARLKRLYHIHFQIALPMLLSLSLFDEMYRELFPNATSLDAMKLLQGIENKTVEGGHVLWRLSRQALATPVVRRAFEELAARDVIGSLQQSAEGRAFLKDLDGYLQQWGTRGDKFATLVEVSRIEDPTPVIKDLKDLVSQPDLDFDAERREQAAEREAAVAAARERLAGYPQQVVGQFEGLLRAAQVAVVLSEDHGFWIDYNATYRGRRVLLEFGRRFVEAGTLEAATDIVHLTLEEIRQTAKELPHADRRRLVAERKADLEKWRAVAPPPAIGTPPPGAPPEDPFSRALGKFFGTPPAPATDPSVLNGAAGAPGVYRGRARVIRSLADAVRLERGDVLVTETTAPPWTPMFATAGAVVTDTGGVLSHCAVVAREYQIPAVVGVGIATVAITDGQIIEVDGTAGIVRLSPS